MRYVFGCMLAAMTFSAVAEAQTPPAAPAPQAKPAWMSYNDPYAVVGKSLAQPHRTNDEILDWSQNTAADVLTLSAKDYRQQLDRSKTYFAPHAWALYSDYLVKSKLINQVTENGYDITTIVNNPPDIANSGPAGGVYHWIIKLPITISHSSAGSDGVIRSAITGKYTLYIDVMRTANTSGDALAINNWRVDNLPVTAQTP